MKRCLFLLITFILCVNGTTKVSDIDYDKQIVITITPEIKLKKAFKGINFKAVSNLKIRSAESTDVNFWECYRILKKIPNLKVLDISECKSLNKYLKTYRPIYDQPLPIQTLVLGMEQLPMNPTQAAIYFSRCEKPIYFEDYPNLQEVIMQSKAGHDSLNGCEEEGLYANVCFDNHFVPVYYPNAEIIRFKRLDNLSRTYQIILGGYYDNSRRAKMRITPENKYLEGVVVADASFAYDLPEKISSFTVPASVVNLLESYNSRGIRVDSLIFEKSEIPLIVNGGGLSGFYDSIREIIVNRPILLENEPGIFFWVGRIIFNKGATLYDAKLGTYIDDIIFMGKAKIYNKFVENVGSVTFEDVVEFKSTKTDSGCDIIDKAKELFFKKTPNFNEVSLFKDIQRVYIPIDADEQIFSKKFHNPKILKMDFNNNTIVDSRLQPMDGLKIKSLEFKDPHIYDVEIAGTNRILYFSTNLGKSLDDGLYYIPVSDSLYLSYSNANSSISDNLVRLNAGHFDDCNTEKDFMVFSYIPVKNENGIEYGRTVGFYIVNPKYGEVLRDFTYWATQKTNCKTPYVSTPLKIKKKTYHREGYIENCSFCGGKGWLEYWRTAKYETCPECGGKGWYIEHYW